MTAAYMAGVLGMLRGSSTVPVEVLDGAGQRVAASMTIDARGVLILSEVQVDRILGGLLVEDPDEEPGKSEPSVHNQRTRSE